MKPEDKLEKIAERVYNASFILTVILILGATIGTGIVRYIAGDSKIELVPDNVFKFIEHVLWIFAVPVGIKIIGDKLPLVVQSLQAWKGINFQFDNNISRTNQQLNELNSAKFLEQDRLIGNSDTYY